MALSVQETIKPEYHINALIQMKLQGTKTEEMTLQGCRDAKFCRTHCKYKWMHKYKDHLLLNMQCGILAS